MKINFDFYENKYGSLQNLLLNLHADVLPYRSIYANPEQFEKEYVKKLEIKFIDKFIQRFGNNKIEETIKEARDMLANKDFSAEWIGETTNRFPFDNSNKCSVEDYREWLKWIIDTLEKEAIVAGKL